MKNHLLMSRPSWRDRAKGAVLGFLLPLSSLPSTAGSPADPGASATAAIPKMATAPGRASPATNAPGFRLAPGFRVELVASEPLVASPLALAFDERGRLFVLESPDGAEAREGTPALGQVRLLEDADETGVFQASTVYADGLPRASALACYGGGLFVAASPDILYVKDRQGNKRADLRNVVLTGLGSGAGDTRSRALPNNFNWGQDNRIHVAGAELEGNLIAPAAANPRKTSLEGRDFAFDPRTLAIMVEAGAAESGLSFDTSGRKFTSNFNRPLRRPMFEPRYYARNPFFPAPPETVDAAAPAEKIFRWSQGTSGFGAGGRNSSSSGAAPAWLTSARGMVLYRGLLFPSNYLDSAFIACPEDHLIHRLVLQDDGLTVEARRPVEERAVEFLASSDPGFRPTQIINGPDGALYVADHRVEAGQGRIYRIVPAGFRPSPTPRLDRAKTIELVAVLAQGNGWAVDTASRLLYERQDPAAEQWFTNMLKNSRLPLARLRALHGLEGQGVVRPPLVLQGLNDPDPRVREFSVKLVEKLSPDGSVPGAIRRRLEELVGDDSIRVRYQVALTAGNLRGLEKGPILAALLGRDMENPWMRAAILSSQGEGAGMFLVRLAVNPGFRSTTDGWQWILDMATMIGVRGRMDEVLPLMDFVDGDSLPLVPSLALLNALDDGLHRTQSSIEAVDPSGRLQRFFTAALLLVVNESAEGRDRAVAARLLAPRPISYTDPSHWVPTILGPSEPAVLQAATLQAMGRLGQPRVAGDLLQSWRALALPSRSQAGAALLGRADRAGLVLDALAAGRIGPAELPSVQINYLRTHHDPAVSIRARQLLGPLPVQRAAVMRQFEPASRLAGVASQGRRLFLDRCAACHQLAGEGRWVGPDLDGVRVQGKARLLEAILEPNLEVSPEYAATVLETREGEVVVGVISDRNALTLTVRQPGGLATVWARECVQSIDTQPWSLMPEGLEQGLATQDLADLLEYLTSAP